MEAEPRGAVMNFSQKNIKTFIKIFCVVALFGGLTIYYSTSPSLDKMVGQMIMTGFHGDGRYSNPKDFAAIEDQIKQGQIGGVILFDVDVSGLLAKGMDINEAKKQIFSSNIKSTTQVKEMNEHLQSIAPTKLLIAIDQEGGNIQRLKPQHGFAPIPSAADLALGDAKTTREIAYDLGNRLGDLGINVDFAPLLDVNVNPESPAIGAKGRSFSADPKKVTEFAGAFATGLEDAKIAYSYKHFPGHGSASGDTHAGITDVTKTYKDYEMDPWRDLLKTATPYTMVMVAHVINNNIDTLPASLSGTTIDMVRNLGFRGVIISDDMDMGAIANEYGPEKAIEMAINAGNDILIFGNNLTFNRNRGRDVHALIVKMVKEGKIKKSRIRESYRRIMKMKQHLR